VKPGKLNALMILLLSISLAGCNEVEMQRQWPEFIGLEADWSAIPACNAKIDAGHITDHKSRSGQRCTWLKICPKRIVEVLSTANPVCKIVSNNEYI